MSIMLILNLLICTNASPEKFRAGLIYGYPTPLSASAIESRVEAILLLTVKFNPRTVIIDLINHVSEL